MTYLAPCFLGRKVYADGEKTKYYVVKYEEKAGKQTVDVLLFDHEQPVIFGIMDFQGNFLDSFFLTDKSTKASGEALERWKEIDSRKKQYRVTQDDLKDALKPESKAKKKNKKIKKLLHDEHLEDIKHQWPSRLLTLQREEDGAEDSLIMETLAEALGTANPKKAYLFLRFHRMDGFIPPIGPFTAKHPELVEKVSYDYFHVDHGSVLEDFLLTAAHEAPLDDKKLIESILQYIEKLDNVYGNNVLKKALTTFSRRLKKEQGISMKEWLSDVTADRTLKKSVVQALKKA
ncbi:hypothetical protein [Alkalicoccus saliphilus]|jgi:hypothetical protein|uniref:Uncharacterized protein n=1 Tax=Alkalicoccus saliphilus TaxID=200989 RepID=A0A2T4U7A4_9BACI|nr:hypothetical protein [Alkalicoccus saliphilus]PTL39283.1 hypothetical protein C6Y45_06625 [Alkalicoccus saliphilus]